jgi:hypothetical protein
MARVARAPGASMAGSASASGTPDWMKDYKTVTKTSPDQLDRLREHMAVLRDKLTEKKQIEERLAEVNEAITKFERQTLPELFLNARVDKLGLEPEGNLPGYDFKLKDYYYANIAADWPPALRDAGFKVVRELGGQDIIKNKFTLRIGRKNDTLARRILKGLQRLIDENPNADLTLEIKEEAPWNSLTAWVKELVETGEEPTSEQKDAIGATIGKIVKPEERKTETVSKTTKIK